MPIKCSTVGEILNGRHDIETLLYTISLEGADSSGEWDNEVVIGLVRSATEAISADWKRIDQIGFELATALQTIGQAKTAFHHREMRRKKKQH